MDYKDMSLGDLAKLTGKSRSTVQYWRDEGILEEKISEAEKIAPLKPGEGPRDTSGKRKVKVNFDYFDEIVVSPHAVGVCLLCGTEERTGEPDQKILGWMDICKNCCSTSKTLEGAGLTENALMLMDLADMLENPDVYGYGSRAEVEDELCSVLYKHF